jgi:hypothetical protein
MMTLEARLAERIEEPSIRLMHIAQKKTSRFPLSLLESFGQIYRIIFTCGGLVGIVVAARSMHLLHWIPVFTG